MRRTVFTSLIASLAFSGATNAAPAPLEKRTWYPDSGVSGILDSCVNPFHLALTWDDGPAPFTTDLIASLKAQNVPSSFFVLGSQVETYPTILKAAFDDGHEILSHGYSHTAVPLLTNAEIIDELTKTENAIKKVTGKAPAVFRMPYGEIDARSASTIKSQGMSLMGWNFDSNDWQFQTSAEVIKYVDANLPVASASSPGKVLLIHDITARSVGAADSKLVKNIITIGKAKGYTFVKLSECLGMSVYKNDGSSSTSTIGSSTTPIQTTTSAIVSSSTSSSASSTTPAQTTTSSSTSSSASSTTPAQSSTSTQAPSTTAAPITVTVTVTFCPSSSTTPALPTSTTKPPTSSSTTIKPTTSSTVKPATSTSTSKTSSTTKPVTTQTPSGSTAGCGEGVYWSTGKLVNGVCVCSVGWTGSNCQTAGF